MVNKNFFKFILGFLFIVSIGISAILVGKNLDPGKIEAVKATVSGFFR